MSFDLSKYLAETVALHEGPAGGPTTAEDLIELGDIEVVHTFNGAVTLKMKTLRGVNFFRRVDPTHTRWFDNNCFAIVRNENLNSGDGANAILFNPLGTSSDNMLVHLDGSEGTTSRFLEEIKLILKYQFPSADYIATIAPVGGLIRVLSEAATERDFAIYFQANDDLDPEFLLQHTHDMPNFNYEIGAKMCEFVPHLILLFKEVGNEAVLERIASINPAVLDIAKANGFENWQIDALMRGAGVSYDDVAEGEEEPEGDVITEEEEPTTEPTEPETDPEEAP